MKTQKILISILLALTLVIAVAAYLRLVDFGITFGNYNLHHWVSILGGAYLIISTIIFAYFKRYTKMKKGLLLKFHVFGNLLAVILVAIHFAHHIGRPADAAPVFGAGLATFILLATGLFAGVMMHFGIARKKRGSWYLLHAGFALSLFIVLVIHALNNFGLL